MPLIAIRRRDDLADVLGHASPAALGRGVPDFLTVPYALDIEAALGGNGASAGPDGPRPTVTMSGAVDVAAPGRAGQAPGAEPGADDAGRGRKRNGRWGR